MGLITHINILSLAKLQAILFGLLGVLCGILYSVGGFIYDLFTVGLNYGSALAFLALLGMPLLFLIVGFVLGFIQAILYNIYAKIFGGYVFDLESLKDNS
jgi:ABC-type proline/glycine betaine transport system permease subunit